MQITLRFSIPEEQGEFDAAINGRKAITALWDINQTLRSLLKHGNPTEPERVLAEQIRQIIPGELLDI